MYPYPTLPDAVSAGQLVADAVRHRRIDTAQEAQAAWVVQGYAQGILMPMPPGVAEAPHGPEDHGATYSHQVVADHLENLGSRGVPSTAAAQQAVPWGVVLMLLGELLAAWRKGRG